jgi:signal transduction histidine kinase
MSGVPAREGTAGWQRLLEFDVALAIAAFIALLLDPLASHEISGLTSLAYVLAFITALPLVQRRRFPLGTLVLVAPLLLACIAAFHPSRAAAAIIVLLVFTVALEGGRRRSLVAGSMVALVVIVAVLVRSRHDSAVDMVAYLSPVVGAVFAGQALRARQELAKTIVEDAARDREAQTQHRFDEERISWAHEVHDIVGHALVAINVRAVAAVRHERRSGNGSDTAAALDDIAAASAEALGELRGTLKVLRASDSASAPLHQLAVLANVGAVVARAKSAGLNVAIDVDGDPSVVGIRSGHAGYRIVQEALTNVLRHSGARCARVRICVDCDELLIEIWDGGPAKVAVAPGGHGLVGMAERAAALGGWCEAGPVDGGWMVGARLPLNPGMAA